MAAITDLGVLRRLYGQPGERAVAKQLDHLDLHCRNFIALSPFCLLASQGPDGLGDATPRGGHPGFVSVADARTIIVPDRPGNRRLDSLSNLIANPGIGMLFLVPGVDETLRVNGLAAIRDDEALRAPFAVNGRLPATVLRVSVKEAYLHCAKALMRSKLWDVNARIDRSCLPTMGEMLKEQTASMEAAESQEEMVSRYREVLY